MSFLGRALATVLLALALPASASAHAGLLATDPSASKTLPGPPTRVSLRYSEAVEPRFATIAVVNADGKIVTAGNPKRDPTDVQTLVVPLQRTPQGWYLVYWRVISADGHPVRGAFTFAVGPTPGIAPQFQLPSLSETAATSELVAVRSVTFAGLLAAVGLLVFRLLIARRALRHRVVSQAFVAAAVATLLALPVWLLLATAQFSNRSATDIGALAPLIDASSFGRSLIAQWIITTLLLIAGCVAIRIDRPDRTQRSFAELGAMLGALACAAAAVVMLGLTGHAAQTSPSGLTLSLDAVHVAAAAIWLGGLLGLFLTVIRHRGALAAIVPRFSRVALACVIAIVASGTAASVVHLPTLPSLWETSYGQALLLKIALLALALVGAAVNLLIVKPRIAAAADRGAMDLHQSATGLLRRTVSADLVLGAAILTAAALLTSLPPPSQALAKASGAAARIGPGKADRVVRRNGYELRVGVSPNRAALPNTFTLGLTRAAKPVVGAQVIARFDMLDMQMTQQSYTLAETAPGTYSRSTPALVMVGHWGLSYEITPRGGTTFTVVVVDRAEG